MEKLASVGHPPPGPGIYLASFYFLFFLIYLLFIYYLFLAVLGLRFCARAFGKWGPLFITMHGPFHYRGLSCCGAQALERRLSSCGARA